MTYRDRRRASSSRRAEWRAKRHEVWVRDKCRCQHCQAVVEFRRTEIDHIRPVARGGTNHMKNLRTLCKVCHATRREPTHIILRERARRKGYLPADWVSRLWGEVYIKGETGKWILAEADDGGQ